MSGATRKGTTQYLQIGARRTYRLRHEILRPGRPLGECRFPGDFAEETFHLGAFVEGSIVGIASFYRESSAYFQDDRQYRLRGMAVRQEGCGYGRELVLYGESLLKEGGACLLWCNARLGALGFYRKLNFSTCGSRFDIPDVGPHFLMAKFL